MARRQAAASLRLGAFLWLGAAAVAPGAYAKHDATATSDATVRITVDPESKGEVVPGHFLGINLSYFNDTEEIWRKDKIAETLRFAGVKALRYPGGQETSFFHWRNPGVNGYEDLWDDPSVWGTAVGRGRFQATWVSPKNWAGNRRFMGFDRYMACCQALGAEPVVGLNLSSGRKHNRRADGIAEALHWMRYCKQRVYRVKYWYLDNEPWNNGANVTMTDADYIEEILAYGRAIKKEFPRARLIINPLSSAQIGDWARLENFIRATGEVVDYVDVHYYWEWGRSSRERWERQTPMESSDQWKPQGQVMPYWDELERVRKVCARAGWPGIGVMVLEWNIGPSAESWRFPPALSALMQAEMLMEFLEARVEIACLWPLIWRTNPAVWPNASHFPSIVTSDPPFSRTPSCTLFRMVASVQGSTRLGAVASRPDVPALAFLGPDGRRLRLLVLNKSSTARRVELRTPAGAVIAPASVETISLAAGAQETRSETPRNGTVVPPTSFVLITAELTKSLQTGGAGR
jgi:hypothetical protein